MSGEQNNNILILDRTIGTAGVPRTLRTSGQTPDILQIGTEVRFQKTGTALKVTGAVAGDGTNPLTLLAPASNVLVKLDDTAGSSSFQVQNSQGDAKLSVNSRGDVTVKGNLMVRGSTSTVLSEEILIPDNHLYINSGYTSTTPQTGGIVVNYAPSSVVSTVVSSFVAGVMGTSNPRLTISNANLFAQGELVQITGATVAANNGLFEVHDNSTTVLVLRGVGVNGCVEDFTQTQLTDDATAQVDCEVRKVTVAVFRVGTDGQWESASGDITPFTFVRSASNLQSAYDSGAGPNVAGKITTNATDGSLIFAGTEAFQVTLQGGMDVSTIGNVGLATSGSALSIQAPTIQIGTAVGTDNENTAVLIGDAGTAMTLTTGAGRTFVVSAGSSYDLDAAGNLTLDSSGGLISIGAATTTPASSSETLDLPASGSGTFASAQGALRSPSWPANHSSVSGVVTFTGIAGVTRTIEGTIGTASGTTFKIYAGSSATGSPVYTANIDFPEVAWTSTRGQTFTVEYVSSAVQPAFALSVYSLAGMDIGTSNSARRIAFGNQANGTALQFDAESSVEFDVGAFRVNSTREVAIDTTLAGSSIWLGSLGSTTQTIRVGSYLSAANTKNILLGSAANLGSINLSTDNGPIYIGAESGASGTRQVELGTYTSNVSVGTFSGATSTTLSAGTGGVSVRSTGTADVLSSTTAKIDGNTAVKIGDDSGYTGRVDIAYNSIRTVNIGYSSSSGTTNLFGSAISASSTTLSLTGSTSALLTGGTVNIATDRAATTNIATFESGAETINIGTTQGLTDFTSTTAARLIRIGSRQLNSFVDVTGPAGIRVTSDTGIAQGWALALDAAAVGDNQYMPTVKAANALTAPIFFGTAVRAITAGADQPAATLAGTVVPMSFVSAPAAGSRGKPVYLSTTDGKVTMDMPDTSGAYLYRVGYLVSTTVLSGMYTVQLAPQLIGQNPA